MTAVDHRYEPSFPTLVRNPKARLSRVARIVGERTRTFEEALELAEQQPWFGSSKYYGADARYFIWQEVV